MPNISQYTKEALENSGKTIRNYQQQEAYGVITIKYDLVDSVRGAAIGVGIGGLAGFALCIPIAGPAVLSNTSTPRVQANTLSSSLQIESTYVILDTS